MRQEILTATDQGRGESAMPEQPDRARGERVQARSHSAAAYRFCPARTSSAGLVTEAHEEHVTLAILIARLRILRVRLFLS